MAHARPSESTSEAWLWNTPPGTSTCCHPCSGGSSPRLYASVSSRGRGEQTRAFPSSSWWGANTINKCRALTTVSGLERVFSKYYLLLFNDILIQSIMPVEQIFCGYEMFTQEQVNYVFKNNSILSIPSNNFLVCWKKDILSIWVDHYPRMYSIPTWDWTSVLSWRRCFWLQWAPHLSTENIFTRMPFFPFQAMVAGVWNLLASNVLFSRHRLALLISSFQSTPTRSFGWAVVCALSLQIVSFPPFFSQ